MIRIALLATGGTIATRATPGGRAVADTAADLLAATAVPPGAEVTPVDLAGRPSFAAGLDDLAALARTVRTTAAAHDAVVVTHGTDTMEESAFLLALTADPAVPVVLTGAQRPADDAAPDGPGNLATALAWAAHGAGGVTVAFARKIWPAVGVTKVHTEHPEAFVSVERGPVATVDGGRVRVRYEQACPPLLSEAPAALPRVDVVAQYAGADDHAIAAAVERGARGIVVAAFGAGNTTPAVTSAAEKLLADGVPVAVASRVGAGPVDGLYAGASADLARAGALFAGDLSPWQARILLALALAGYPADPAAAARRWCEQAGVIR